MRIYRSIIVLFVLVLITGCGVGSLQQKGYVAPENFHTRVDFTTVKTVMIIPAKTDGVSKNFLFDTGAQVSLIQRDTIIGKSSTMGGASKGKAKVGSEIIGSMRIGDLEFRNTYAGNMDFKGLKEQIPDFGGLIGQPIISKANWLIDYPNKRMEISDSELADATFQTLEIERKGGSPYTFVTINEKKHRVVIDFGSSSRFNVPRGSKLADELMQTLEFKDRQRERYTIGGLQNITEKVGVVPLIKLGNIEFKNVEMNINTSSQPRIGISFFEDCIVYIDNTNGTYKVKKVL